MSPPIPGNSSSGAPRERGLFDWERIKLRISTYVADTAEADEVRGGGREMDAHNRIPTLPRGQADPAFTRFEAMVGEAQELLRFALSEYQSKTKHATLHDISELEPLLEPINAAQAYVLGRTLPDPKTISEFEKAYYQLSLFVEPVTAETLRATDHRFGISLLGMDRSHAWWWSIYLWCITYLLMALIVGAEVSLKRHNSSAEPAKSKPAETTSSAERATVNKNAEGTSEPAAPATTGSSEALTTEKSGTEAGKASPGSPGRSGEAEKKPEAKPIGITLLQFLLPFLYGALGSCAYLLRSCHEYIFRREFDPDRTHEYVNRMFLGAFSGGLLYVFLDTKATGYALAAPVLAFVAGYASDRVFSKLEGMLDVVLTKPQTSGKTPSKAATEPGRPAATPETGETASKPPEAAPPARTTGLPVAEP